MRLDVQHQLGPFARQWDELVAGMALPSPFLRSWWLEGTAGRRPRFVLLHEGGQLAGGVALEVAAGLPGVPLYRVMGAGPLCPDHLDVVCAPSAVGEVTAALREWACRPGHRAFDLTGVAEDAALPGILPTPVETTTIDVAPYLEIDRPIEELLRGRPGGLASQVARQRRRLERAGAQYRVVGDEDAARALDDLRRLHEMRWADRSGFLAGWPSFERAALGGIASGDMILHELVVDGQPIAVEAWFHVAGRVSYYQGGRDTDKRWDGSGNVVKLEVVERAGGRVREVDFLRGDEGYKRQWTDDRRLVLRCRAGTGAGGRAVLAAMTVARRAKAIARRSLPSASS